MRATPYTDAINRARGTIERRTGRPPQAIRLGTALFIAWRDEVLLAQRRLFPLPPQPAARTSVGMFDGIEIYTDPTVPPGQIDVVDQRGGRVLIRVDGPPLDT